MSSSKKFKCMYPDCNWSFPSNYKLERHIKSHTGDKDFKCPDCSKLFANAYGLRAHQKIHDIKKSEEITSDTIKPRVIRCPKKRCTKDFLTKQDLNDHLSNHDYPYVCQFDGCSKKYAKQSRLKQHETNHNQNRPFKCTLETCMKSFSTKQKLTRHQLIHENKKTFSCSVSGCDKAFNCKEYLIAHNRIHQPSKQVQCPVDGCFKHFSCSSTLKVHLMGHANYRPFKCTHKDCDKTYLTASNLRNHQKVHKHNSSDTSDNDEITSVEDQGPYSDINELMNMPAMDISIMSKEELVAATIGEIACSQYMNCEVSSVGVSSTESKDVQSTEDVNVLNDLEKEKLKDLQEEFVRNIYASTIYTDHSFLPSYLVSPDTHTSTERIIDSRDNEISSDISETVTLEPSMELSTGHLEIDGACFEASSCMPDHLYSNKLYGDTNSTVNLKDIQ